MARTHQTEDSPRQTRPTILVVGPSPEMLGGMAGVVEQMRDLDLDHRYRVELCPITVSPHATEPTGRRLRRHLAQLRRLRQAIARTSAAIVHIHTCSGFSLHRSALDAVVARRAGCRTVLHVHGAAFDKFHAGAGAIARRLIRTALTQADRVVALSGSWRDKLLAMAPKARVVVVENAVALPPRPASRPDGRPCRFLFLARLDVWKGVGDLLDAAALLHQQGAAFELTLAGPSGTAGDASAIAVAIGVRGLKGNVRYVGPVLGAAKAQVFAGADVFIQPSHHEGMPLAMLEAFAAGLPAVATRVGAVPEMMKHRIHGLLVPPSQPEALAGAMHSLAADARFRRLLGRRARMLAETRFGLARFRDDLLALYDSLLDTSQLEGVARGLPAGEAPGHEDLWHSTLAAC